ncbi:MAG: hypothetical protein ABIP11_03990 [Luteimonas sp.]
MTGTLHPLADDVSDPAPQRHLVAGWKLWAGLLLAPLAFSLQVVASYTIGSDMCSAGGAPLPWLVVVNITTALLAGFGMFIAWSNWHVTRRESGGDVHQSADRGDGRTRFMALFGLIWSALSLLAVVVQVLALVYFGPCTGFSALG